MPFIALYAKIQMLQVGEDVEQWVASEDPVVGSDTVSHRSKYGPIKHQGGCLLTLSYSWFLIHLVTLGFG